jgi:hypothetical protein
MGPSGCRKAVVLHHWLLLWNKRNGEASSWVVVSPELWRAPQGGKKGNRPRRPHKGKGAKSMNRLALDTALIGRLHQEPPQQEPALGEAQTHTIPAGSENRWELRRSVFPKLRRGFQSSSSPLGKDAK